MSSLSQTGADPFRARSPLFFDRAQAGRILAHALDSSRHAAPVVIGLGRDGLAVAREVARHLAAPLEVMSARGLALPESPRDELAAFADGGGAFLSPALWSLPVSQRDRLDALALDLVAEISSACRRIRGGRPLPSFTGRRVILVDDGLLTGMAMAAAADSARRRGARAIIGAAPVASEAAVARLRPLLDEVVCPVTLGPLESVAGCYRDFRPVTEVEALDLLAASVAPVH